MKKVAVLMLFTAVGSALSVAAAYLFCSELQKSSETLLWLALGGAIVGLNIGLSATVSSDFLTQLKIIRKYKEDIKSYINSIK